MRKVLFVVLLLAACDPNRTHGWENNKVTVLDKGLYRISTENKDEGVYDTVQEKNLCPHNYMIEKTEAKVWNAHWPTFYNDYTIRCLLPVNMEQK